MYQRSAAQARDAPESRGLGGTRGIEFEGLTLSNVAEGELEKEFQEVLPNVVAAFAEPELYEHTAGVMICKTPLELVYMRHAETGTVHVSVRAAFKPPKRREIVRAAWVREGAVLVEKAKQLELPTEMNVTKIRQAADEGDGA